MQISHEQLLMAKHCHACQGRRSSTTEVMYPAEHYGFCLEDNPDDQAFLPLEAFSLPELVHELDPTEAYVYPCGTPSWQLLDKLLALAATPPDRRQACSVIVLRSCGFLSRASQQHCMWICSWLLDPHRCRCLPNTMRPELIGCRSLFHRATAGLSPAAGTAAMACLERACRAVLAELPTSLQEDEAMLSGLGAAEPHVALVQACAAVAHGVQEVRS